MSKDFIFDYPNYLNIIFDKLYKNNIFPIIVGGYVRDYFLGKSSKDIDIELYGVPSIEILENILSEFAPVSNVGKSFGVLKMSFPEVEVDFSLPRKDSKVAKGHKGISAKIDSNLDFATASSRRDFTINAIGYDVINKIILDPHNGQKDLKNKILRAVDINTFSEDPLRVLRAVGFASRFSFVIEKNLLSLCTNLAKKNILYELPSERIYEELKKLLLKSSRPSYGFKQLKIMQALKYFSPLDSLNDEDFKLVLEALDRLKTGLTNTKKTDMFLLLTLLCYKFNEEQISQFISNLTTKKKLVKEITSLLSFKFSSPYSDSELMKLASQVNIEHFLCIQKAIHPDIHSEVFTRIKKQSIKLGIYNARAKPFLQGKDILDLGIKPSKIYATILASAYEAQMNLEVKSKEDALQWLKSHLSEEVYKEL